MEKKNDTALRLTAYRASGETREIKYPLILSVLLMIGMALAFIPAFESIPASPLMFALAG